MTEIMKLDHMDELYHSPNPLVRYIHIKRLEIIKELVGNNKGRLLDCGCGEGHLLEQLCGEKYGVDGSFTALKRAKERNPDAKILKGDITNLPFDDGFFDIQRSAQRICSIKKYVKEEEKKN